MRFVFFFDLFYQFSIFCKLIEANTRGNTLEAILEAIHIRKEKPGLNTRDEFRSRELTLKI